MLIEHLTIGGIWFMLPIYILWVTNLALTGVLVYRSVSGTLEKTKFISELILFLGSFAFLFGVLGQVLGMMETLACIREAGDISPALIFEGFRISLLTPIYGFVLFIGSLVVWFISRRVAS